jgi:hypothetical protein
MGLAEPRGGTLMKMATIRGVLVVSTPVLTSVLTAHAQTVERSLEEWLAVQGTFCLPDGAGGCLQWQGPQPNIGVVGDPDFARCGLVDYAGVHARWLTSQSDGSIALPTSVTGTVKEHTLPDGTAEITVRLVTTDALAFAVQGCAGATLGPVLFGWSPAEVLAGATPSLGDASLKFQYIVPAPGLPFHDLVQVIASPEPGTMLVASTLDADSRGELRAAFGVPDGTPGTLSVVLLGIFDEVHRRPFLKEQIDLSVE